MNCWLSRFRQGDNGVDSFRLSLRRALNSFLEL